MTPRTAGTDAATVSCTSLLVPGSPLSSTEENVKTASKLETVSLGLAAVLASAVTAGPAVAAEAPARTGSVVAQVEHASHVIPRVLTVEYAAQLPSCSSIEYPGVGGKISVQTAPDGTVSWGITM
ncbi:MAG: hypothetical protein DLM62_09880 [Pseudonocardiales bacterium]|nr:MAG: hypothetical protein DLM62_09880 [Pseudonocardiales bacterium]